MANPELLAFAVKEIALEGRYGCPLPRLFKFVDDFFENKPQPKVSLDNIFNPDEDDDFDSVLSSSREASYFPSLVVGDKIRTAVWDALRARDDVTIGRNDDGRKMSLADIMRDDEERRKKREEAGMDNGETELPPEPPEQPAPSKGQKRVAPVVVPMGEMEIWKVYANEEQIWRALTGHGIDRKKVPPASFALLLEIGRARKGGILQPNVSKMCEQDPRSVATRTKTLHELGYIEKKPVLALRMRTSLLTLRPYVQTQNAVFLDEAKKEGETRGKVVDMRIMTESIFSTLRQAKNQCLMHFDLKRKVYQEMKFDTYHNRVFARMIRKLEAAGYLRRILVPVKVPKLPIKRRNRKGKIVKPSSNAPTRWKARKSKCVQLKRDFATGELDAYLKQAASTINERTNAGADEDAEDDEGDDGEEVPSEEEEMQLVTEQINAAIEGGNTEIEAVSATTVHPEWKVGRPLESQLYHLIKGSGTEGISSITVHGRSAGRFYYRPIDQFLLRLTSNPKWQQPFFLSDRAVVRETDVNGRNINYRYFTLIDHDKLVADGVAEPLEDKNQTAAQKSRMANQGLGEEAYDEYGFPKFDETMFLFPDRVGSIAEAQRRICLIEDRRGLVGHVRISRRPDGRLGVDWSSVKTYAQQSILRSGVTPEEFASISYTGLSTPLHMPLPRSVKEDMAKSFGLRLKRSRKPPKLDALGNPVIRGRPRKYARGEEPYKKSRGRRQREAKQQEELQKKIDAGQIAPELLPQNHNKEKEKGGDAEGAVRKEAAPPKRGRAAGTKKNTPNPKQSRRESDASRPRRESGVQEQPIEVEEDHSMPPPEDSPLNDTPMPPPPRPDTPIEDVEMQEAPVTPKPAPRPRGRPPGSGKKKRGRPPSSARRASTATAEPQPESEEDEGNAADVSMIDVDQDRETEAEIGPDAQLAKELQASMPPPPVPRRRSRQSQPPTPRTPQRSRSRSSIPDITDLPLPIPFVATPPQPQPQVYYAIVPVYPPGYGPPPGYPPPPSGYAIPPGYAAPPGYAIPQGFVAPPGYEQQFYYVPHQQHPYYPHPQGHPVVPVQSPSGELRRQLIETFEPLELPPIPDGDGGATENGEKEKELDATAEESRGAAEESEDEPMEEPDLNEGEAGPVPVQTPEPEAAPSTPAVEAATPASVPSSASPRVTRRSARKDISETPAPPEKMSTRSASKTPSPMLTRRQLAQQTKATDESNVSMPAEKKDEASTPKRRGRKPAQKPVTVESEKENAGEEESEGESITLVPSRSPSPRVTRRQLAQQQNKPTIETPTKSTEQTRKPTATEKGQIPAVIRRTTRRGATEEAADKPPAKQKQLPITAFIPPVPKVVIDHSRRNRRRSADSEVAHLQKEGAVAPTPQKEATVTPTPQKPVESPKITRSSRNRSALSTPAPGVAPVVPAAPVAPVAPVASAPVAPMGQVEPTPPEPEIHSLPPPPDAIADEPEPMELDTQEKEAAPAPAPTKRVGRPPKRKRGFSLAKSVTESSTAAPSPQVADGEKSLPSPSSIRSPVSKRVRFSEPTTLETQTAATNGVSAENTATILGGDSPLSPTPEWLGGSDVGRESSLQPGTVNGTSGKEPPEDSGKASPPKEGSLAAERNLIDIVNPDPIPDQDVILAALNSRARRRLPSSDKKGYGGAGGMLSIARRQVILDLLEDHNGVFPGGMELRYAFRERYMEKNPKAGTPDRRLIVNVLNTLQSQGKVREIAFAFNSRRGLRINKRIIMKAEMSPDDDRVTAMKEDMIKADGALWFPKGFTVSGLVIKQPPPPEVSRQTQEPTEDVEFERLFDEPAPVLQQQQVEKDVQAERLSELRKSLTVPEYATEVLDLLRHLKDGGMDSFWTMCDQGSRYTTMRNKDYRAKNWLLKVMNPEAAEAFADDNLDWMESILPAEVALAEKNGVVIEPFVPDQPKDIKEFDAGLLRIFLWEVYGTIRPDLVWNPGREYPGHRIFINHNGTPLTFNDEFVQEPIFFEDQSMKAIRFLPPATGPSDKLKGLAKRTPIGPNEPIQLIWDKKRKKDVNKKRSAAMERIHKPPRKPKETTNEDGFFTKLPTREPTTRRKYVFNKEEDDKLLYGTTIVRTLLSNAADRRIDWSIVHRILPHRELPAIKSRWSTVRTLNKPRLRQIQADLEDMYLEDYAKGLLPDFDQENFDINFHLEWFTRRMKAIEKPIPELPATYAEFDARFILKEEKPEFDWRNQCFNAQLASNIRLSHFTAQPSRLSFEDIDANTPEPTEKEKLEERCRCVMKSNLITEPSKYKSREAHAILQAFGDNVLHSAFDFLKEKRTLAPCKPGAKVVPGRNYEFTDNFHNTFKQNPPQKLLRQAVVAEQQIAKTIAEKSRYDLDHFITDGGVLAIINLVAQRRLDLKKVGFKAHPDGIIDGYKTRSMDKSILNFSLSAVQHPSASFIPPTPDLPPPEFNYYRVWFDINKNLVPGMWTTVKAGVIAVLLYRPGIGVREIAQLMGAGLMEVEVGELVRWLEKGGMVRIDEKGGCWSGEVWWRAVAN